MVFTLNPVKKSDPNTSPELISLFHYIQSLSILLIKQVIHGDLAVDVISIAFWLEAVGGNHREVDGFLGSCYVLEGGNSASTIASTSLAFSPKPWACSPANTATNPAT